MSGANNAGWGKTKVLVELRCLGIVGAYVYGAEAFPGDTHQGTNKCASNTLVSPSLSYVNPSDSTYLRISNERVTIKTANRDQQAVIKMTA